MDLANGVPDREGVGVFTRLGFADRDTNPVKWSVSGGVGGRGMIPFRGNDLFGAGYYYTSFQDTRLFSDLLGFDSHGQGFEAFYNLAIAPAAHLSLDLQLQNPAVADTGTAVVFGTRLNLAF